YLHAIPYNVEEFEEKDKDGFIYKVSWYTKEIVERPFKNENEAKEQVKKDIFKIKDAIENKKFCSQGNFNVRLFGEDLESPEVLNYEFKRIQDKMDGTIMMAPEFFDGIGPLTTRYNYDMFFYLYKDYPELIGELLDVHIDYQLFRIESFNSALTPVATLSSVIAGTKSLIFSPNFIRKEVIPRMQKLYDNLNKKGYLIILELHGDISVVFNELVGMGVQAYGPIENLSNKSIEEIKMKYPKLILMQMIDSSHLLPFGTSEEIVSETKKVIDLAKKYGGIFIGSTSDIHEKVSIKNALAMYETARNYNL
ncbi:MAG: hypothetical protein M1409_11220, partial [Actinobacteria bacterium]|nr:hypothetical protein [Actinomycetota bacterium]